MERRVSRVIVLVSLAGTILASACGDRRSSGTKSPTNTRSTAEATAAASPAPDAAPKIPPPAEHWNFRGKPPHLVAHYMPWFGGKGTPGQPGETWRHWKWDGAGTKHDPEQRLADGRR